MALRKQRLLFRPTVADRGSNPLPPFQDMSLKIRIFYVFLYLLLRPLLVHELLDELLKVEGVIEQGVPGQEQEIVTTLVNPRII